MSQIEEDARTLARETFKFYPTVEEINEVMSKIDEIEFPVSSYDQIKLAENTINALKGTWDNTHNPLAPKEFWKASGYIRKAIEQLNKFLNPNLEERKKERKRRRRE